VFHEKNQELCEWLTQMENKVERDHNLDMVEKLKKVGRGAGFTEGRRRSLIGQKQ